MSESRKDVVKRLQAIPAAEGISDAELCRRIKCSPTAWANYVAKDGKRIITRQVAYRLCDEFNVTLDWIYRGKSARVPQEILKKYRDAA